MTGMEPRSNPMLYVQFMTEEPRIYNGERMVSLMMLGKLDSQMQKNEAES